MDRHLLKNLIVFVVLIIFGLAGYLIVVNLLLPPDTPASTEVTKVLQGTVNPSLALRSLELMRNRQDTLTASDSGQFDIYLENLTISTNDKQELLHLMYLEPIVPLDRAFPQVQAYAASLSAQASISASLFGY